jgi:transaldolase
MRLVVTGAAQLLEPTFQNTGGKQGYVCAQVNPKRAGDREGMLAMARRFHAWAPNIAVKLPVTAAGLDVLEECAAEGITVTMTVSFTVPQVVAIGERFEKGTRQSRAGGHLPRALLSR